MKGKSSGKVVQTDRELGRVRCYQLDSPAATEGTQTRPGWLTLNTTLNSKLNNYADIFVGNGDT